MPWHSSPSWALSTWSTLTSRATACRRASTWQHIVASGGISTLGDIRALAAVGEDAIEGAITGRALYEGNFTLAQALAAVRGEE